MICLNRSNEPKPPKNWRLTEKEWVEFDVKWDAFIARLEAEMAAGRYGDLAPGLLEDQLDYIKSL